MNHWWREFNPCICETLVSRTMALITAPCCRHKCKYSINKILHLTLDFIEHNYLMFINLSIFRLLCTMHMNKIWILVFNSVKDTGIWWDLSMIILDIIYFTSSAQYSLTNIVMKLHCNHTFNCSSMNYSYVLHACWCL